MASDGYEYPPAPVENGTLSPASLHYSPDTRPNTHRLGQEFCKRYTDTYPYIDPTKHNLSGRAVLVTGASKGVGRAAALAYAKAGASHIAVAARSLNSLTSLTEELASAAKSAQRSAPQVLPLAMDVTSLESVTAAIQKVSQEFGKLDILINNAGYLEPFLKVTENDPKEWWKVWETNMLGVYNASRAAIPLMVNTQGGFKTLVNMSSVGAHNIAAGASGYQSTKAAVTRFTEFLCVEYAKEGLVAFSTHPGGIKTDLALGMPEAWHGLLTDTAELAGDALVYLTAQRRVWLAGRYVACTWDMEEFMGKEKEIVEKDLLKVRLRV